MITAPDLLFDKGKVQVLPEPPALSHAKDVEKSTSQHKAYSYSRDQLFEKMLLDNFTPNVPVFTDIIYAQDLGLEALVNNFFRLNYAKPFVMNVLTRAPIDIETIHYRRKIIEELTCSERKMEVLRKTGQQLYNIAILMHERAKSSIISSFEVTQQLKNRVNSLEQYVEVVNTLETELRNAKSVGLSRLHNYTKLVQETEQFQSLSAILGHYRSTTSLDVRVTLGANREVTNLEVLNPTPNLGKKKSWIRKLWEKISPPATPEQDYLKATFVDAYHALFWYWEPKHYDNILLKFFDALVDLSAKQIEATLLLAGDFEFYSSAISFHDALRENKLPASLVEIDDKEKREHSLYGITNPLISLGVSPEKACGRACENRKLEVRKIEPNDFIIVPQSNLVLLTGPNGTGKSRYVTSVGLMYVLIMNGLHAPVREGSKISLIDGIHTQFVCPDDLFDQKGRWKNEVTRCMERVVSKATPYSLCLIDDFGSGTSYEEAREPALTMLYSLYKVGSAVLMNTHIHELANDMESGEFPGAVNKQMEVRFEDGFKEPKPTFKVIEGKAEKSYAQEIAFSLGLSRENVERLIQEKVDKGILPKELLRI